MKITTTTIATMSSFDLVETINSIRPEGQAELRHDNFMVKIEKHPGIMSPKFLGYIEVPGPNGGTRKSKCYHLPKRECELMVMSESLEVQTKVYDRMSALEQQLIQPPAAKPSLVQAAKEFRAMYGIARLIGLDKNASAISANQVVAKTTGANFLQLLGHTHLESEKQELYFTPTELGLRLGVSGMRFNLMLAEVGLQVKSGDHWVPQGKSHFQISDTSKRHGSGAMIQQVKWSETVLPYVNDILSQQEKAA